MFDNIKSPDTRKQTNNNWYLTSLSCLITSSSLIVFFFHMFLGKNEKHVSSPQLRPETPVLSQLQSNLWNDHPIEICFKLKHQKSSNISIFHVVLGWKHLFFPMVNGFPMVSHAFPIVNLVSHGFPMVFLWFSYMVPMVFPWFEHPVPARWTRPTHVTSRPAEAATGPPKMPRPSESGPEDVNILWLISHVKTIY